MTTGPRAACVLDLGFGDAGKGLLVDHLVRARGADLVVRHHGGAQAGHNVVAPDGRHHTFAQFGAGTFVPGVRTLLGPDVVVHPTALLAEADALARNGVDAPLERITVHADAPLVVPAHQAACRLRELLRSERHGSVGVGVGEAVRLALESPGTVPRAADLAHPAQLAVRAQAARERLAVELRALGADAVEGGADEWRVLAEPGPTDDWLVRAVAVAQRVAGAARAEALVAGAQGIVFEGAQGVLLDENHGFHPFTTWSDCTPRGARALLERAAPSAMLETFGVLRAHGVRHGPGPFPGEARELDGLFDDHNRTGPWQGHVRYGWFDAVLARYALAAVGGVDRLVVTHVDGLTRSPEWRVVEAVRSPDSAPGAVRAQDGAIRDLEPDAAPDLERREAAGRALLGGTPVLRAVPGDEAGYLAALESLLGRRIDGVSRGPRAADVDLDRVDRLFGIG